MPKIYRVMKGDADGLPTVGERFGELGVRPSDMVDNPPNEAHPAKGGMSVQPSLEVLSQEYLRFVPKRLRQVNPRLFGGALGGSGFIWTMGRGPFVDEAVSDNLRLRCDQGNLVTHGVVEPEQVMSRDDFQSALAATRNLWVVEET